MGNLSAANERLLADLSSISDGRSSTHSSRCADRTFNHEQREAFGYLAALMLMTSSNFVGCSTGRSPGFAPLRILST